MLAVRKRILLGALYVLLTLVVLDGALWIFQSRVKTYFDEELGRRLTAIATTISFSLDRGAVGRLLEGAAAEAEIDGMRKYLESVSVENELAGLYLLDLDERDLLWSDPGDPGSIVINLDPVAVAKAEVGLAAFSETYKLDDMYFKSGYAPVLDDGGGVIALVAAEADAGYFTFVTLLRRSLLVVSLLGLAGAAVLGVLLVGLAKSISRAEEAVGRANLLATLGRMAAAVAHDIRNPLGIIGGAAQRLKSLREQRDRGPKAATYTAGGAGPRREPAETARGATPCEKTPSSEEAELLDFITEEVDRLDSIVSGYLEMAKPAEGASRCEVLSLIERAAGMCGKDFSEAGIEIVLDTAGSAGAAVAADAAQLQQAFLNIMANAREAMPMGGRMKITARRIGAEIVIEFHDSGAGISSGDLKRVREPFFSTKQSGSGLGLAVVDKVVADGGGRLEIESERGAGTTVRMALPLSEE